MIRVLITEDSPVVRGYLKYILNADPDIEVVGMATNGEEAVTMVSELKPDVVTMDIHMPKMDGFEATRNIMETHPVPIVICSASWNPEEVDKTFRTMEAGAVAALEKPGGIGHPQAESSVRELIQTVKMMSDIKVVRRWSQLRRGWKPPKPDISDRPKIKSTPSSDVNIVVVGASTGGPLVLQTILANLPTPFPVPVVIVQHIALGFLAGLGDWLEKTTRFPVSIPQDGEQLVSGRAYLAPNGHHMGVSRNLRTVLAKNTNDDPICPSVSHLFESAVNSCGNKVVGVILTGMGRDGAAELKMLRDRGAVTIAQDEESSVVHGMPGEAIKLDGVVHILPPEEIAAKLEELVLIKDRAASAVTA